MRKTISSILITVIMLANFLAPVSVGWNEKKIEVRENAVEAQYTYGVKTKLTKGDTYFIVDAEIIEGTSLNDSAFTTVSLLENTISSLGIKATLYDIKDNKIEEKTKNFGEQVKKISLKLNGKNVLGFGGLNSNTLYKIKIQLYESTSVIIFGDEGSAYDDNLKILKTEIIEASTLKEDEEQVIVEETDTGGTSNTVDETKPNPKSFLPKCGILNGGTPAGCVAQVIYYLIFMPSSVLFALAGTFFDNTFAFSVNDASYQSTFVIEGWNVVRDLCNMFFIFVLLYIAFQTILNINGSKTKEMIINVVIIGLLINFSLFATRVIIDASNILARVFYNSNTIQITALDDDGSGNEVTDAIAKMNATGVLPLSAALVNKVNPQALIINADEIGEIPDKGMQANKQKRPGGITTGTFIFVTLLASAVNIIGFIVFLTIGLMFVVRVVGLWLAMIVAPFAFFSYTVPRMQEIDMVGWKRWWPETIKLAFMAPVFIFFLYLILQFLETGLGFGDMKSQDGMLNKMIVIFIPFAFIIVLLMQAKKIAVKMAGQMGEGVAKFGSTVGGLALGAGVGLGAMAMRGTIGKYAANVANSDKLKADAEAGGLKGWQARQRLKMASGISKSTFDARTILGKKAESVLGVNMGKAKEGGYAGKQERKAKKIEEMNKLTKPSTALANKQDADAKEWNDKYNEDMINTKNKKEANGEVFDENEFMKKYEKGEAEVYNVKKDANGNIIKDKDGNTIYDLSEFKGSPRVLNANENERQRMSDKASRLEYGDEYIEKRDAAKKDYGPGFNETKWRNEQLKKGKDGGGIERKTNLSELDEKLIKEYRKQGTPEKAPINAIEKDRAEKTKMKAEKTLSKADEELEKVVKELKKIADNQGVKGGVGGVNKQHIMTELILPKQEQITKHEVTITQATAAINKDPYNTKAKEDLLAAQLAKKKLENEIDDAKSLLSNKEKYENIKNQQTEIIKQQDDKLLNR